MSSKKINPVKMTYDIVFKKFFVDKPNLLKLVLKHFLELDTIENIIITNPQIPQLEKKANSHTKEETKEETPTVGTTSEDDKHTDKLKKRDKNQFTKEKATLQFLDSHIQGLSLSEKRSVLDLRVKLSSGESINVEMQSYSEERFLSRCLYYWARLHSQSLKKGESYDKMRPTYSLIFVKNPILDKRVKDFISVFSIRREKEPFLLLSRDLKIVIVELSK